MLPLTAFIAWTALEPPLDRPCSLGHKTRPHIWNCKMYVKHTHTYTHTYTYVRAHVTHIHTYTQITYTHISKHILTVHQTDWHSDTSKNRHDKQAWRYIKHTEMKPSKNIQNRQKTRDQPKWCPLILRYCLATLSSTLVLHSQRGATLPLRDATSIKIRNRHAFYELFGLRLQGNVFNCCTPIWRVFQWPESTNMTPINKYVGFSYCKLFIF